MSHHSSRPNAELTEAMRRLLGEYPDGRMNDDDAGAIAMQVGTEADKVVIRFPKPVAWVGMTGDQAMHLAQDLMKHARRAGIKAPVVLRIGE